MALTEIGYGSLASSKTMNENFQYLDNRISDLTSTVISNQAGFNSNVASLNNMITSMHEEINEQIDVSTKELKDEIKLVLSENAIYLTTYIDGTSWYKEYFSDNEKTNRVWLEQGGICGSISTTTYLKAFSNTNYTLTLGTHDTNYEHGGISGKTATGFSHYDGKGWNHSVEWRACGL